MPYITRDFPIEFVAWFIEAPNGVTGTLTISDRPSVC